jgi:hypothetical protein
MTEKAVGRKTGRDMVWIRSPVEIILVAARACCRCPDVDSIPVTRRTWLPAMIPGQGELRRVVVKGRGLPCCRCMTDSTIERERGLRMFGAQHRIGLLEMASGALDGHSFVLPIRMALSADHCQMCTRKRELRSGMVKRCRPPGSRRVACPTFCRYA